MRYLAIALVALTGCATPQPPAEPTGPCRVDEALKRRFAGTEFRMAMRNALQLGANARTARVLGPDDAATMDYRPDRLNIRLDAQKRITGLDCG